MKVTVKYKEEVRPIESVTITLTPEEVEYIRYWASLASAGSAAGRRLDALLPKTGAQYLPEKCFLP